MVQKEILKKLPFFSKKIVLGSASPRRKLLLEEAGFQCEIRKIEVEENYPSSLSVYEVPSFLAQLKALPLKNEIKLDEVLLTADTVVIFEEEILHKPKNRTSAIKMLQLLSGKTHQVITAVHLYNPSNEFTFFDTTKVYFNKLSEEEISYYVDSCKPFDKAGGYGIQEWIGKIGIRKIEGSYFNVMGLPVDKIWASLNEKFR